MNIQTILDEMHQRFLNDPDVLKIFSQIELKPYSASEFAKIIRSQTDDMATQMMVSEVFKSKCAQNIIDNGGTMSDYKKIQWMADSVSRLPMILACYSETEQKEWLELLKSNWSSFDYMYQNIGKLKTILKRIDKELIRETFISGESLEFYNDLPDEIIIYRGGDEKYVEDGICWTLVRDIANKFCSTEKFSRYSVKTPRILERKMKKKDIFGIILDRYELEVIYFDNVSF